MNAVPMPRQQGAERLAVARVRSAAAPVWRLDWLTWPELATELTTHSAGRKDGPGWMPAAIEPGERKAERVQHVSLLALDVEAKAERQPDGNKRVVGAFPPPLPELAAELALCAGNVTQPQRATTGRRHVGAALSRHHPLVTRHQG